MKTLARPHIHVVVSQHAEESTHLRHVRSVLLRSPHAQLHRLQRLDDRIAAHLDGIAVAGDFGLKLCLEALETPSAGAVFALAVRALELKDAALLHVGSHMIIGPYAAGHCTEQDRSCARC